MKINRLLIHVKVSKIAAWRNKNIRTENNYRIKIIAEVLKVNDGQEFLVTQDLENCYFSLESLKFEE